MKHLKRFRRWLKFALSRKTRNRSAGQKAAWVRRKNAAGLGLNGGNPTDASEGLAPAVPDSIMDTNQDAYARKRGYDTIDNYLDDPRRGQARDINRERH